MDKAAYESRIGKPVYWKKDGRWRVKHRGLVFWVPAPNLERGVLNKLADKAEAAMLRQFSEDARRKARCLQPN